MATNPPEEVLSLVEAAVAETTMCRMRVPSPESATTTESTSRPYPVNNRGKDSKVFSKTTIRFKICQRPKFVIAAEENSWATKMLLPLCLCKVLPTVVPSSSKFVSINVAKADVFPLLTEP